MHQLIEIDDYIPQALRTESDYAKADLFLMNRENQRLLHAAMGLCTEGGEIQDHIKRAIFYGKPLDLHHLKAEAGDVFWYLAILCDVLKTDPREILAMNIAKLRARFPNKFDAEKAVNRDLENEKQAEQGYKVKIFLNGQEMHVEPGPVSYETICAWAHFDSERCPTMVVNTSKNSGFTVIRNNYFELEEGQKIDCLYTGNA